MRRETTAFLAGCLCAATVALVSTSIPAAQGVPESAPKAETSPAKSALLVPPRVVRFLAADFPEEALIQGLEADVRCGVDVDDRGEALLADCESGPPPVLVRLASSALASSRYAPGRVKGHPVFARLEVTYRFALSADRVERRLATSIPPAPNWIEVEGNVLSQGVRAPIPGADVIAQGVGIAAITDAQGHFRLWLPAGSNLLVASSAAYLPSATRVEVAHGSTPTAEINLLPHEVQTLQATVVAEREHRVASKDTLVREELRNVPGSQDDPLRVVELLPGIARAPYTGGQLIVRGGNAEDTGAYIDGQRVPQLYHLQNGPSVVSEEMVERIDFSAGGAGAYYGRSLSGVVSILSRRGDPDRWHGSIAVDLQKSSLFLQGPIDNDTDIALGARHSYPNPLLKGVADDNKSFTVPIYWDYQLRIDRQLTVRDRLTLTAFGSHDNYEQVGNGRGEVPSALAQEVGFHRIRLAWEHRFDTDTRLTVAPTFGVDVANTNESGMGQGIFLQPQHDLEHTVASGGRAELSWKPRPFLDLRAGVDILVNRVHYDVDQLFDLEIRSLGAPNAEEAVLNGVKVLGSFAEYVEGELRWGNLRVLPGLRFEQLHYGAGTFGLFEPRVALRYALDVPTSVFAYAGIYHQAPDAEEVAPKLGNPYLLPLRADQYGLGIERKFGEVWSVKAEAFLNVRTSLVFPAAPQLLEGGSIYNPLELNSGRGHAYGLEIFLRHEFNARFYGWIAYTLSRSRETPGFGQPWLPTPYDQPQVLNFLVGIRVSPLIELAVRLRLASGNPIAPVLSTAYNADSGAYVPIAGPLGSGRLPTFAQLDFEVNSVWIANYFQISLYVDFQNILSRDNSEVVLYDYRYRTSQTALSQPFQALVGAKAAF